MARIDKECEKAAKILKGFVEKHRIPVEVIAKAKGLAIFSGFRAGVMYFSGTGGSGVVIARLPDGSWSAPSAFSVLSGGIGAVGGVDVYDCVCVLNTQEAVNAYAKNEMSMGADASVAAGPIGGSADISMKEVKPVWTYVKSRGLWAGLTVDGTRIKEKSDINTEAYGYKTTVAKILNGEAIWPPNTHLPEVLKLAEGESVDPETLNALGNGPTPGDLTE